MAGRSRHRPNGGTDDETVPLRAAVRLTGLSPDVLRAWERRYGVVEPLRSDGGTRRYRISDVRRLARLKAAVDAGHRISEAASWDDATLEQLTAAGVKRISVGATLVRLAYGSLIAAAREMAEHGSFGFADDAIDYAELEAFFQPPREP